MRILLYGGSGFIGRHIALALSRRGHEVTCVARDVEKISAQIPYSRVEHTDAKLGCGFDCVVNAVGDAGKGAESANLLFAKRVADTAANTGAGRLVVVSALGASRDAPAAFLRFRHESDEYALKLFEKTETRCVIVRPSVVVGRGGASTRLLSSMAAIGVCPDVKGAAVQPVHVEDHEDGIASLVEAEAPPSGIYEAPGPETLSPHGLSESLALWMGLRKPKRLAVPLPVFVAASTVGGVLDGPPMGREIAMCLATPNIASGDTLWEVSGHEPKTVAEMLADDPAGGRDSTLAFLLPMKWALLTSLAVMWIATGVLSATASAEIGFELLAELGVERFLAPILLFGGAAADIALGISMVAFKGRSRKRVLTAQLCLMAAYTAIVTVFAPWHWLHPLGPILKNLPVIAATGFLYSLED